MNSINLTINDVPKTPKSIFKYYYKKYKDRWLYLIKSQLEGNEIVCFSNYKICIKAYTNRLLDYDNFIYSLKPLVDSLVALGVLLNDNYTRSGSWDCEQIKSKEEFKTTISIFGEKSTINITEKINKKNEEISRLMLKFKSCYEKRKKISIRKRVIHRANGKIIFIGFKEIIGRICSISYDINNNVNSLTVYDLNTGKRFKFTDKMLFRLRNKIKVKRKE